MFQIFATTPGLSHNLSHIAIGAVCLILIAQHTIQHDPVFASIIDSLAKKHREWYVNLISSTFYGCFSSHFVYIYIQSCGWIFGFFAHLLHFFEINYIFIRASMEIESIHVWIFKRNKVIFRNLNQIWKRRIMISVCELSCLVTSSSHVPQFPRILSTATKLKEHLWQCQSDGFRVWSADGGNILDSITNFEANMMEQKNLTF